MTLHDTIRNCFNCHNWAKVVKITNLESGQEICICETCAKKMVVIFDAERNKPLKVGQKVFILVSVYGEYPIGNITVVDETEKETNLKYQVKFSHKGNDYFNWCTRDQLNPI